jgi:hypothetical protein
MPSSGGARPAGVFGWRIVVRRRGRHVTDRPPLRAVPVRGCVQWRRVPGSRRQVFEAHASPVVAATPVPRPAACQGCRGCRRRLANMLVRADRAGSSGCRRVTGRLARGLIRLQRLDGRPSGRWRPRAAPETQHPSGYTAIRHSVTGAAAVDAQERRERPQAGDRDGATRLGWPLAGRGAEGHARHPQNDRRSVAQAAPLEHTLACLRELQGLAREPHLPAAGRTPYRRAWSCRREGPSRRDAEEGMRTTRSGRRWCRCAASSAIGRRAPG